MRVTAGNDIHSATTHPPHDDDEFPAIPLPPERVTDRSTMADVDAVPNRGPELLGVNIFFLVIALTACLLRMYTRLFMVKAFGVDDGLMVLSTVCVWRV